MTITLSHVNAFATEPFLGNPAGVCLMREAAEAAWMQDIARQVGFAETAFLHPESDGFRLRWFTPAVEVDLCGHATLASAHVLWAEKILSPDQPAKFQTRSGLLTAVRRDGLIEMNFPATPVVETAAPAGLIEAVGATAIHVGRTVFDYFIEVRGEGELRALSPDMAQLRAIPTRGVIVTSRSEDPQFDFVSRFFAPASGVDEDPVTGSAHCALGPFWAARLQRARMTACQRSSRGGVVHVEVRGDRVLLAGHAVTTLRKSL
jgi:PhzF family phenazine biosynthesis protein